MRSLIPNPSVEPNDMLLTIIPKSIIDNARLSIAKKIPLNLLTKNPKKKETIKPAKIEKAIAENPDKAPTGVTEFAKNYGIGKPNYLSAYIAKLITEGKLPEDYFVKQDMTEFQKKGTED